MSLSESTTPVPHYNESEVWDMPEAVYLTAVIILSLELIMGLLTNTLLIITICYSPSLKTPPNAQLISICVNNLLLTICMLLSEVSLATSPGEAHSQDTSGLCLGHFQLFLTVTCLLQYWCIFSAIGFYRSKTLKKPSMSLCMRRKIIRSSIWIGWLISSSLGLILTLTHRVMLTSISWNPFRRKISLDELDELNFNKSPSVPQSSIMFVILLGFLIGVSVIVLSYHKIFTTLYVARPGGKNKVSPWARSSSLSSEDNDFNLNTRRSYRPSGGSWAKSPFTISSGINIINENTIVHYQKHRQSLTFDVFALENPLRAQGVKAGGHGALKPTLSNSSSNSAKSHFLEFTDITPAGELQRLQKAKNHFALRNQSMRRERISLSAATKNSLVMLATYFLLSFPMAICSLPGVLPTGRVDQLSEPLLFCRLAFYLNAPAYPVWYLVFSRRVRKCLHRIREHVLIKLNLRK